MAMTEKQGGSDVRTNTTRAEPVGARGAGRALRAHRAQMVLLGAHVRRLPHAGPDGRAGPVLLPPAARPARTASRNAFLIQRLKDKLGNRSNASAEVEYDGALAWLVGEEGRGIPTIIEMVNHTRLDVALISHGHDAARAGRTPSTTRATARPSRRSSSITP